MDKYAVIVAGGSGQRMSSATPKQFLQLHQKPLLWYTLNTFLNSYSDIKIVLVLPKIHFAVGAEIVQSFTHAHHITMVEGGTTRFESVQNGLKLVPNNAIVLVHDGVRCLLTTQLIQRCCEAAILHQTAIPVVASIDSVRLLEGDTNKVLNRNQVMLVQTPQAFNSSLLKAAFQQPYQAAFTDEATVVELFGEQVHLVEGEYTNIKITQPLDMVIAEHLLKDKA